MLHKSRRKLRIAYNLLRDEGATAVGIRTLQFIQKRSRSRSNDPAARISINTSALYQEILAADPTVPANESWPGAVAKKSYTFNWLMPPPGKGSGGHMTLFRFIRALEQSGHTCRIYFHKPGPYSTVQSVVAIMGDSFPVVSARMEWLKPDEQMADADGIFATSWETAYSVYASSVRTKKFYFVQDFEPFFYPVGSLSVLAENTYRLGLRGITAGGWLRRKLHDEYGMVTDPFSFGSDSDVYRFENTGERQEIVFYARPTTDRRAFELGIMTLDLFHREHPDFVINFIGWDVSQYDIPFPYNNLGILDPHELNELYNRCAASLVMSLTNMSLLPLELLSSGCIPVVNDGENNRLVSDNPSIAYAPCDPISLARTLGETVTRHDATEYARTASKSVRDLDWERSGEEFVATVVKALIAKGSA